MNERDREFVGTIRHLTGLGCNEIRLLGIIDRLDKQLTEIVEAGKPFGDIRERIADHVSDDYVILTWLSVTITAGTIRRLAKALENAKE